MSGQQPGPGGWRPQGGQESPFTSYPQAGAPVPPPGAPGDSKKGGDQEKGSRSRAFREWIQTTTGVISTVVAIAALGGGGAAIAANSGSRHNPNPASTVSSTSPTSALSADAGGGWTVSWSGPVGITPNGLNFDNNPPSSQSADIFFTGSLASNDTAILATWPQSRAPTAAECLNWVTTHPSGSIGTVTAGMQICLKTQQGHPVLLRVAGATSDAVQANATIWQQQ
jgi:hypothetical protein